MKLSFSVPRAAVSVNATYKRSKQGRLFMSPAAREFKEAVAAQALKARQDSRSWPMPSQVRAVFVSIVAYGSRHDVDAGIKLILDAMEGILYAKDVVVEEVTARKGKEPVRRVDIEVTLLD